jgi:hypothetical protein
LGTKPIGDVQPRHDLDAGDQGQTNASRQAHDLPEHTVDAIANDDVVLLGLDMDIACPRPDALCQ